jgi:hypothetical protein
MNIDERLIAITQTLEQVARMLWKNEARIERLLALAAINEKSFDRLTQAFETGLRKYFSDDGDGEGDGDRE